VHYAPYIRLDEQHSSSCRKNLPCAFLWALAATRSLQAGKSAISTSGFYHADFRNCDFRRKWSLLRCHSIQANAQARLIPGGGIGMNCSLLDRLIDRRSGSPKLGFGGLFVPAG